MKKVMILGAGRGQVGLYKAAKKLGYETIAVSIDGDYPGFALADEKYYLNLYDAEGIAALASEIDADGVVTACLEIGLPAVGLTCDKNQLPGISYKAALTSTDKALMKEALVNAGVRTAHFKKVYSKRDLEEVKNELSFPLITKAVDLSGTRGIHIAFSERDLVRCWEQTMQATGKDYCVIEEYLEGYECSATAMIVDGEVVFVLPTGDLRYGKNDEVPIGHYLPYEDSEDILQQITDEVTKAIYAMHLNNCAVNVDIMICREKAYILELTGRIGANCMPELTSIYLGFDIHEMIVETAVGNFEMAKSFRDIQTPKTACIGKMIISEKEGIIKSITTEESDPKHVEQIWMFVSNDSEIRKFTNPKDCIGQIVVKGEDLNQCNRIVEETIKGIHIELEEKKA